MLGDDTSLPILGVGNLANGSGGSYTLSVLHLLGLRYNLLSVQELCKLGLSLEFAKDKVLFGISTNRYFWRVLCLLVSIGFQLELLYLPLLLLQLFGTLGLVI